MTETTWAIQEKQPQLYTMMDRVLKANRVGHAYIFEGMSGAGQIDLVKYIAAYFVCQADNKPCGHCQRCRRIQSEDYPDLIHVKPEGQSLKIDQIRGIKQKLTISALEGDYKFFVIEQAETMTTQAANSLLKFIEEPYPNMFIFLLTANKDALLPTILSRCQILHFQQLNPSQFEVTLKEVGMGDQMARVLSHLTNDITKAQEMANDELFNQQMKQIVRWLELLIIRDPRAFTIIQTQLIKLTKDREDALRGLELMGLAWHDLLVMKLNESQYLANDMLSDELIYPQQKAKWAPLLPKLTIADIAKGVYLVNHTQRMIQQQVTVQGALEYFVLAWWKKD